MSQICISCNKEKPFSAFSKKKAAKTGYSSKCKDCHNLYIRTVWYPKNQQKQIKSSEKWRKKNHVKKLAYRYNTSEKEILDMLTKQDGKCAICKKKTNVPHLDHCHSSGILRGWLCRECNLGLGLFQDNKQVLKNAIKYLS